MTGHLVICDEQQEYCTQMMDYLNSKVEGQFSIRIYTECNALLLGLKKTRADVALIDEKIYEKIQNKDELRALLDSLLIITEKRTSPYPLEEAVYRYQSAGAIVSKIFSTSECRSEAVIGRNEEKGAEIIGIFSPVSHVGKTSLAITMGQIYAEKMKTLFLSLEAYSGITGLLSLKQEKTLGELLYDFDVNRDRYPAQLYTYVQSFCGMDTISPIEDLCELQSISKNQLTEFIRLLSEECSYEKIIIDFGSSVVSLIDILAICDVIYVPTREDVISQAKLASFADSLKKQEGRNRISDRIRMLTLPEISGERIGFRELSYSTFGVYVRGIING